MRRASLLIYICLVAAPAAAQQINLPAEISNEAALLSVMPRFAKAVIAWLIVATSMRKPQGETCKTRRWIPPTVWSSSVSR